MIEFIKKNIFIGLIFLITLSLGFVTFLTFIDKSFLKLTDQNLQLLLSGNIVLLLFLFYIIFREVSSSLKIDVDVSGSKANRKYITFFALFTLIPSILISLFSLFLLSFALDKYLDKKITTAVNNSYEIAKSYTEEMRTKTQSEIILEKQITRNRFIALGLLLVFAISVATAIHYYNKSVTANSNLIIEKQKLVA